MSQSLDLGFDISSNKSYTPYKIDREMMPKIFENLPEEIKSVARNLRDTGWRFYAVRQDSGWCRAGNHKIITIPSWAIVREIDYRGWYVSHELAHAMDNCIHNHGPEFMEWLKKICPKEWVHHEIRYKPRNARAAGIRKPGEIDLKNITLTDL